jgi:hypothetical protein
VDADMKASLKTLVVVVRRTIARVRPTRGADKAKNHVIDEAVLNVLHPKMNYMNDPVLEEPRFVEVFSRIRGE